MSDAAGEPEDDLAHARAEQARLWDELNRLRAERREVEYFETRMHQMETSLSWQLTTPLRSLKRLAGKVRRRSDGPRG